MTKKQIAEKFLETVSAGQVHEAFAAYVHPDFFHHNAFFKGDRGSLLAEMAKNAKEFPNKTYRVLRSLEDGDLVTVHGRASGPFEKDWSVIHIFRFEGDKIMESWEASQEDLEDSPNANGIF